MPSHTTYAAPTSLSEVYAVADAATSAPRPSATPATWTTRPRVLPTTDSSASRRPTVSARPMVNSRLGPGTWMNRIDATTKASSWLVLGMSRLSARPVPGANPFRAVSEICP